MRVRVATGLVWVGVALSIVLVVMGAGASSILTIECLVLLVKGTLGIADYVILVFVCSLVVTLLVVLLPMGFVGLAWLCDEDAAKKWWERI